MKKVARVQQRASSAAVHLPPPVLKGQQTLEECLRTRRSSRFFAEEPLSLEHVSQLVWAAQGVTGLGGLRASPSPGAVYPLHLYLIAVNVSGLRPGAYAYDPDQHVLALWKSGNLRARLVKAACDQPEPGDAAAAILVAATFGRMQREFGDNGVRLAYLEAGHAAENVCLQATALSLGVLTIGRIDVVEMKRMVDLPEPEEAVYLILAGSR
jgi:SagB-type dehydrogenase family enzyme